MSLRHFAQIISFTWLFYICSGFDAVPELTGNQLITGDPSGFSIQAVLKESENDVVSSDSIAGSLSKKADVRFDVEIKLGPQWFIPISIGTPPQRIFLAPDLAAPDLAVESFLIDPSMRGPSLVYDPSSSTTAYLLPGYTFRNKYLDGKEYSGVYFQDTVKVGGLTFFNFTFETANKTNTNITAPPNGVFGMNTDPWNPIHVFTIDYHKPTSTGTIDFGFIDPQKYNESIGYAPLLSNNNGLWSIPISGILLNNRFYPKPWNVTLNIFSTSAATHHPRWAIDMYFSNYKWGVWNQTLQTYTYRCNDGLIDFVFGVGDNFKGVFRPQRMRILSLEGSADRCWTSDLVVGDGVMEWGRGVLASFFVVFDYGGKRVGFGNKY